MRTRTALFWAAQRVVVLLTDVSGQSIGPETKDQELKVTLKMGRIGCPEMSVRQYHYSLRYGAEECS